MKEINAGDVGKYALALGVGVGVGVAVGRYLLPRPTVINRCVDKGTPKICHTVNIEDIADKKSYCRCWQSASFPLCDGSHNKHNEATGDNVGPITVKK